jgi:NADH dehydrogenase (ubiquinone) flavoprotein 2
VWARPFSHALSQHKNTEDNTVDTPFEWSEESKKQIPVILAKYPPNRLAGATMPLLQLAQKQNDNWLPVAAMNKVAEVVDAPPVHVYEVATFFTMYNREKVGKYHLQCCGTSPCLIMKSDEVMAAISDHLGIQDGETTADGLFTLSEVECLGACVNAPMMQVSNEWFYENLTPENVVGILEDFKAGKTPKVGPQTKGLTDCEGPMGKTSLFDAKEIDTNSMCRDFDALKKELEQQAKEDAAQ